MYCSRCGTQNKDTAKFCDSCGLDLTATTPVGALSEPQEVTEIEMVRKELDEEYEIVDELGRGGMAIVFKAKEKQLDREVAIKVLPFSLAFDKEFVERFQREARTSAKLEHPNIIPIYRVGKSGRVIYFVMKFLRGKPLSSVLAARGAGLPPAQIRSVLADVCRALAYAHKSGIVHRDIKPDNIMFDEHGLAVVTDFGIAKAASGGKLTGTGMSIGTPHYMSPEQARAQPLDGRSDIYSLGVVAFQSLTGRVPFDGEDSFSIGYKHIMEEIPTPPLETYDQRTVFEITRKMMAKSPDERFQSADDLVTALEAGGGLAAVGLATAATKAMPSLAGVRMASAATTPLPRIAATEEHHKRSVAAGIALWVVVVAIGLGAPGLYAYKKGLLFFARAAAADSASGVPRDTLAQRLLSDTGVPPAPDAAAQAAAVTPHADTARTRAVPPGALGHLTLQGLPAGARVTLNGMLFRGSQGDVPPGTYALAVRASGFEPYDRQVVITPGAPSTVRIELQPGSGEGGSNAGPCDQYGPAYNQDNLCFDTRPLPLSLTRIPVPADATIFPRQAILLIHVSKEGSTIEARVFGPSNLDTFNNQALDMAKTLRWNPAQKNGEPVDAWVQWIFQPVRQ